jgi:acetoin utilization deacetylase AcuC-like enzyme
LKVVYSSRYALDLGPHVFPTSKYRLVHARLLQSGTISPSDVVAPTRATWRQLARVHTPGYLARMRGGALSPDELAQLQLPWSPVLADGFRTMVGGTIQAAAIATGPNARRQTSGAPGAPSDTTLQFCVACHIGGGLHHAFPSHGEGFCPFNDVAVATRHIQAGGIGRVAIIDLDVHHGNGTAFIFESDPRVFTFSMHQRDNYPAWKPRGSLDIHLPDGTGDEAFLRQLSAALPTVMASDPECVFYLAGSDPYEDDQLGGLRLTRDGLRMRDHIVIEAVRVASRPLVILLAGGYARRIEDTVEIHAATIEEAARSAATLRSA